MSSNSFSALEDMPFEIKASILSQISDLPSLSAIIRASPHMYAVYAAGRDKILSSIVFPTLASWGLDLTKPARHIELYSHKPHQDIFVPTVHSWYSQLATRASRPIITMQVSKSLLQVALAVTWYKVPGPDGSGWIRISRPETPTLPQPRPDNLCIIRIPPGPDEAYYSVFPLIQLLKSEGYRRSGVNVRGADGKNVGMVMTSEPYDPRNPER